MVDSQASQEGSMAMVDMERPMLLNLHPNKNELMAWKPKLPWSVVRKNLWKFSTSKFKKATSHGCRGYFYRLVTATMFAADPFLKAYCAFGFWVSGNTRSAVAVVLIFFVPIVLMFVIMNSFCWRCVDIDDHQRWMRKRRFAMAAGGPPTVCNVIYMHFKMALWTWVGCLRGDFMHGMKKQQQMYRLLQTNLAVLEQILFTSLQITRFVLSSSVGRCNHVHSYVACTVSTVLSHEATPATISAVFGLIQGVDLIRTYTRICTGGNVCEFKNVLFSLGYGAAAPALLSRLRNEKDVNFNPGFSSLDRPGLMSVFRCIKESPTLMNCTFEEETGSDGWFSEQKLTSYGFDPGKMGIVYGDKATYTFKSKDMLNACKESENGTVQEGAPQKGYRTGERIVEVDGEPYSKDALMRAKEKSYSITSQATYTFNPGEMGITCDDNGLVLEVSSDGQAHTQGINQSHRVVNVGSDPYSKPLFRRAQESGSNYTVTLQVTYRFKTGEMGIILNDHDKKDDEDVDDDDGLVLKVIPDGQAHTQGMKTGSRVVKVDTEPYSKKALLLAQESASSCKVTLTAENYGFVVEPVDNGQAYAKYIRQENHFLYRIVKVNDKPYSKEALSAAEDSGRPYTVCFDVAKSGSMLGRKFDWQDCIKLICLNRQLLDTVQFVPKLERVPSLWEGCFESAQGLGKVTNGDADVYRRDVRHPPTDLRKAIDKNDTAKCKALLDRGDTPTHQDFMLAAAKDYWKPLAAMLAIESVDVPMQNGDEVLLRAASDGSACCVALLLFWKANANCRVLDPRATQATHKLKSGDMNLIEYDDDGNVQRVDILVEDFKFNGEMGIDCSDDGIVRKVIENMAAHTQGIRDGQKIVNVDSVEFSQKQLAIAENSGSDFKVTVQTTPDRVEKINKGSRIVKVGSSPFSKDLLHRTNQNGSSYTITCQVTSTPLLMAAFGGHGFCMTQLQKAGAKIHDADSNGEGILHKLAYSDFEKPVAQLVAANADANLQAKGSHGWTPLHLCAIKYAPKTARELLLNRAQVDTVTLNSGNTPLHNAAHKGSAEVVRVLLNFKADTNKKGKKDVYENRTPLEVALRSEYSLCIKLIENPNKVQGRVNQAANAALNRAATGER